MLTESRYIIALAFPGFNLLDAEPVGLIMCTNVPCLVVILSSMETEDFTAATSCVRDWRFCLQLATLVLTAVISTQKRSLVVEACNSATFVMAVLVSLKLNPCSCCVFFDPLGFRRRDGSPGLAGLDTSC